MAFFPFFGRMAWFLQRGLGICQTPSHRVASVSHRTALAPTLIVAVGDVFFLQESAASVVLWSEATPLFAAHSMGAAAALDSLAATASSSLPSTHHPMSSTKRLP
jgi:hypothetical protein